MWKALTLTGMTMMLVGTSDGAMPIARAADSCGGTLIEYVQMNVGGRKVGQLQLYYNSSNGNNCAEFLHAGPTWGTRARTGVSLNISATPSSSSTTVSDVGSYAYMAGPVRRYGRNKCASADGYPTYQGRNRSVTTRFHCG